MAVSSVTWPVLTPEISGESFVPVIVMTTLRVTGSAPEPSPACTA